MTYWEHKYLSNSGLSKLEAELSGRDARDLTEAYRRGTIVDVMITDQKRLNIYQRTIQALDGTDLHYTDAEIIKARKMRDAFFADPICSQLYHASNLQEEVYLDDAEFGDIVLGIKCKCDGRLKAARWPWDLKRTSCRTLKDFEATMGLYSYDRQSVIYITACQSDRMLFIGISDHQPHHIFKVFVKRGDDRFRAGFDKAYDLIQKFDILCG